MKLLEEAEHDLTAAGRFSPFVYPALLNSLDVPPLLRMARQPLFVGARKQVDPADFSQIHPDWIIDPSGRLRLGLFFFVILPARRVP